jgi:uncharacterized membrane protein YcaP (DUF421 family)
MNYFHLVGLDPGMTIWEKVLRAAVVYLFLLIAFRLTGKRQVGQMTTFDLVVVLVISNVLQNAMIGADNSVAGGLLGAAVILIVNFIIAEIAVRSRRAERILEPEPTVLIVNGKIIEKNLRKELISIADLHSALRKDGIISSEDVKLAVLEPNGAISIIKKAEFLGMKGGG